MLCRSISKALARPFTVVASANSACARRDCTLLHSAQNIGLHTAVETVIDLALKAAL